VFLGPKPADERADHDLFRTELLNLINQRHELVRLAALIDWQAFEAEWSPQFVSTTGRPALPTRLMAALLYLKHMYALSDEDVCEGWGENPYWQHFSGERYFQHELSCDPSSLVRWRQRIGEAGCEWLLVVGMCSMPGNPYDGHTVGSQLEQVGTLTGQAPKIVLADRGCRGVEPPEGTRLLISHTRRLPKRLKKLLKRRQVVESMIGHMKSDGLLAKNWLKGASGDALHAILCGAGHNLRMILAHLRVLYCALLGLIVMAATLALQMAASTSAPQAFIARRAVLAQG
jgi:Transposase domain (DUF772)